MGSQARTLDAPTIDRTLEQGGVWEHASFTRADKAPVEFDDDPYLRRFGKHLEAQGFTVMAMQTPDGCAKGACPRWRPTDEGRDLYHLWAWCKRRPVDHTLYVPDRYVPRLAATGLALID